MVESSMNINIMNTIQGDSGKSYTNDCSPILEVGTLVSATSESFDRFANTSHIGTNIYSDSSSPTTSTSESIVANHRMQYIRTRYETKGFSSMLLTEILHEHVIKSQDMAFLV
jgi:hypothetical protein